MNPSYLTLFEFEFGRMFRTRSHMWVRLGLVGAAFIVYSIMHEGGRSIGTTGFNALFLFNAYILGASALGQFSSVIAREREQGTFSLLSIVALPPAAVLFGKGTSLVARLLLAYFAQIPIALFCHSIGGPNIARIASAYALLGATAFLLCHTGLFWSVFCRKSQSAGQAAALSIALLYSSPFLLRFGMTLARANSTGLDELHDALLAINPVVQYRNITMLGSFPLAAVIFHLAAGVGMFAAATAIYGRSEELDGGAPTRPELPPLPVTNRRTTSLPRADSTPFAWREFHFAAGGHGSMRKRWYGYITVVVFVSIIIAVLAPVKDLVGTIGGFATFVGVCGLIAEVLYATGRIFGLEITSETLASIVITPVSAGRIALEKIAAYLRVFVPSVSVLAFGLLLLLPWNWLGRFLSDLTPVVAFVRVAHAVVMVVLAIVLSVQISLTRPGAHGAGILLVIVANVAAFGISQDAGFGATPAAILLTIGGGWLLKVVIRTFPASVNRAAGR